MAAPTSPSETSIDSFVRAVGRAPEIPLEAMRDQLAPGEVLGGAFRIERELGRGGMGVVFQARDLQLERDVAIKVMRADRWPMSARPRLAAIFEREAKATARLNHPGIVTLHGAGQAEGVLYLVLELLRGASLTHTLERGAVPAREALELTAEVVRALVHAHAQGILHRDLKPQNVFVTDDGRVKLLDFGLASLASFDDGGALALSRAGTPAYMAPEQWRGDAQDARTDVWAAGVMLYQLVRGALPFAPAGAAELERALPIAMPETADPIAKAAHAIVARATAWAPDDRYATAADLLAALDDAIAAGAPRAELPSARTRRASSRRRAIATAAAAAVAAGAIVLVRGALAGPGAPPVIADGEWTVVHNTEFPSSPWHGAIRKIDDLHYRMTFQTARWGTAPSQDYARNDGVFELKIVEGTWRLVGDPRDVDGWCCGAFGHVEFTISDEGWIRQELAYWGDRPGHYLTSYGPWWYERTGPLTADAR